MKKIKAMSRLLSFLFQAGCWIYSFYQISFMVFKLDDYLAWLRPIMGETFHFSNLSFGHHLVIVIICCIPLSITILIYHQLAKLFQLYEQGYLFELENIKLIKSIGIYIIVSQLIQCIYLPLLSFALTFFKPAVAISFNSSDFSMLVTGLVVLTASWIAEEAHELKLDTQLTF